MTPVVEGIDRFVVMVGSRRHPVRTFDEAAAMLYRALKAGQAVKIEGCDHFDSPVPHLRPLSLMEANRILSRVLEMSQNGAGG